MTDVTIDHEDLKALLYAAGALAERPKAITFLNDAQVDEVKDCLPGAVKRAGDLWREAGRRQEFPERFLVPSERELSLLRQLEDAGARDLMGAEEDGIPAVGRAEMRSLSAKGFIEFGVYTESCIWANSGPRARQHIGRRIRMTPRGCEALAEARENLAATMGKGLAKTAVRIAGETGATVYSDDHSVIAAAADAGVEVRPMGDLALVRERVSETP